jgi:hypothetical protein
MKLTALVILIMISTFTVSAQIITVSKPATLQAILLKEDGSELVMLSNQMVVTYDKRVMKGALKLSNLSADDVRIQAQLDSLGEDIVNFTGIIPEGKFLFHETIEERFSVEADLLYRDHQSRIIIEYIVSNFKSSLAKNFTVICTGTISLQNDLGVTIQPGIKDEIRFQFSQNVQNRAY